MRKSRAAEENLGVLRGGKIVILSRITRVDLIEKVTFEQLLEGSEKIILLAIWGRVF